MSTQTGNDHNPTSTVSPSRDTVRGGYETHTPRVRSTETRKSFRTTEFFAFVAISALTLLAAYTQDGFDIDQAWTLVAVITSAYMLSRGIAKAGSREPRYDDDNR